MSVIKKSPPLPHSDHILPAILFYTVNLFYMMIEYFGTKSGILSFGSLEAHGKESYIAICVYFYSTNPWHEVTGSLVSSVWKVGFIAA